MKIKTSQKALTTIISSVLILTPSKINAEIKDITGDVKALTTVNIRYSNEVASEKLGIITKNETAKLILSYDNNWLLINYNDKIGFVHKDYFEIDEKSNKNYTHIKNNDIVYTTTSLNFRLGPSIDDKKIETIKKGEELIVLATTNNEWYLVKYKQNIGYVKKEYTLSLKEEIKNIYPNITNIEIEKIGYANKDTFLIKTPLTNEIITTVTKYESFRILEETENHYLIKINNQIGYVNKINVNEINGTYIIIDISDQKIVLFKNNEAIITSNITTGKISTPTNIGLFKIYAKQKNRYLTGEDYQTFVSYWMPFDGGIGLHGATWRTKFGGQIYKKNGSHGCVNLPPEIAKEIYEKVEVGTKVLVHK